MDVHYRYTFFLYTKKYQNHLLIGCLKMLIDTHCHINILVKNTFDVPLEQNNIPQAAEIIKQAEEHNVTKIINVGTSLIESINCIELSKMFRQCYASAGIHPNDCQENWRDDFKKLETVIKNREPNTIVAIGETGLDRHYPGYNIQRQQDAFKAHIECSLEHNLPLIIHTRSAHDEVLTILDEYKQDNPRGVIHCFSEDQAFADHAIELGFVLGIGGTLTYPKNTALRDIFTNVSLEKIILETDAPYLPPQSIRGKKNHPREIATIAHYLAELRQESFETIAKTTTATATALFGLE